MTRLIRRSDLEDVNFFVVNMWFVVPVVVGLVIGGAAGGIAADSNSSRRALRTFAQEIQRPRVSAAGEYSLVAVLLHELAGDQGSLQEYVTIRYGQKPDALALLNEITDAAEKSKQLLYDYPEQVKLALAEGEFDEAAFSRLWSPWRTFFLLLGIGWASGSLMVWLVLCWWYGIFEGRHPYSGLGWNTLGVYAATLVTLPGVVMNAGLVGIFYVVYGITIAVATLTGAVYPMRHAHVRPSTAAAPAAAAPVTPDTSQSPKPHVRTKADVAEIVREYCAQREATRPAFVSLLATAQERQRVRVRSRLTLAAAQLENARRSFVAAEAEHRRVEERRRNGFGAAAANRVYDQLWSHAPVICLHVDGEEVCVHLETTIIPHNGLRYEIGDFALRVTPGSGAFRVLVLRQTSKREVHPFWEGTTGVCFGDAARRELSAFVDDLNYPSFVDLAAVMMQYPHPDRMQLWKGKYA